ncbi:MAG: DUF3185 family protein [Opitutaceae bacterium]
MSKIISLILIIAGIYVCYLGNTRKHSVAGGVDSAVATVADKVTGEGHTTDATWYYVGGGVLILVGVVGLTRGGKP